MKRCFASLAAALILLCVPPARAGTNIVTTLDDGGPGSLREAISLSLPGDLVWIVTNGTIVLTSGELVVNKDLTIQGPGMTNLAISGNGSNRVFRIDGVTVQLLDLTVKDGRTRNGTNGHFFSAPPYNNGEPSSPGGGIFNSGSLALLNCALINNRTGHGGYGVFAFQFASTGGGGVSGHGGAIYSTGPLALTNCLLTSNLIGAGGLGGDNGTSYGLGANAGNGGAIYGTGTTALDGCTLAGNQAGYGGGGSGGGQGGSGGGIYCTTPLVLNHCVFNSNATIGGGNSADGGFAGDGGNGGGICALGGGTVRNCAFNDNRTGSGGIGGSYATPGPGGKGGAIYNGGSLELFNCAVRGSRTGNGGNAFQMNFNPANGGDGGGLYSAGSLVLMACTISGNWTGTGGRHHNGILSGLLGHGGGIFTSGSLALNSCTIISNKLGGSTDVLNSPARYGGGVYSSAGTPPQLLNSIVARNLGGYITNSVIVAFPDDLFGSFASQGHNLIGVTNGSSGFPAPGDLVGSRDWPLAPELGALNYNRGLTLTHAPLPGSPVLDAGDDAVADTLPTDQRGSPRFSGLHVDIGAFELLLPHLTGATRSNGAIRFVLHGAVGGDYVLQVSSNLVTWQPLLTNTIPGNGQLPVSDSSLTNLPMRFYRAVPQ